MLTVPEAAALLGVKRQQVWRLVRAGKLKAEYHGKIILINEEEVARYVTQRRSVGYPKGKPRTPATTGKD